MGKATLVIDAKVANAIQGLLKVSSANKGMEKSFGKAMNRGKKFDRGLQKLKQTAVGLAGGFLGVQGVRMAVRKTMESFNEGIATIRQFEDEMTALLSLGKNIDNIDAVKGSVINMSNAFGMSRGVIADAMFRLQSGAGDVSQAIRDDLLKSSLRLVKVAGGELPTTMRALLKTFLIYGDEVRDVADAQGQLFKTMEMGDLTMDDLASSFPDLISAAKSFGFTLDEVSAAVIVSSKQMGSSAKAMRQLRNVFAALTQAESKGIEITGDFVEQMRQLGELKTDNMLKLFGKENVTAAAAMGRSSKEISTHLVTFGKNLGDVISDSFTKRLQNSSIWFADISKSIAETRKNLPAMGKFADKWSTAVTKLELRQLGAERALGPELKWIGAAAGWLASVTGVGGEGLLQQGRAIQTKEFQKAGEFEQARELNVRTGNIDPVGLPRTGGTRLTFGEQFHADEQLAWLRGRGERREAEMNQTVFALDASIDRMEMNAHSRAIPDIK